MENSQCLPCHEAQAAQWRGSHHARAMATPTAETVSGDFDGAEFEHQGLVTRFFERDGKYLVHTDGPDGKPADFEVAYAFGVEPVQQYLIALDGGRLQALQVAWDTQRKRWFHLQPEEHAPAGDVLHWTGRYQTANTMCLVCHTTGYEKRFDAASGRFDSRWSEPNVSCQSCHGPGQRHVDWAAAASAKRPYAELPGERRGLVVVDARGQVDGCAACHSRRSELSARVVPGEPRLNHTLPVLLTEGLYHPDGQQLDEVYVDGSYRQSKMFQQGVGCTACHDPHTGKLRAAGNGLCLQCHAVQGNPAFPSAAGHYDEEAHHRHPPGSAGAQCVACHMPSKRYLQVQARPDHSLRIPRPDLSVTLGTPNACNGCHVEQSAQWAADQVISWYGETARKRLARPHFGVAFAAARAGAPGFAAQVLAVAADPQQPAIVRATALDALRGDPDSGLAVRLAATRDTDPEVRAAAAESHDAVPAAERRLALAPLLTDPVRAVRIAAARSLSSLPVGEFDAKTRLAFEAALAELISTQELALDMPGANLNLAVVYQRLGRTELAEKHSLAALRIDPDFTAARVNLAQFHAGAGRTADAERVLREGLLRLPGLGELQYALGLLLAEDHRLEEASAALTAAATSMPSRASVHYNLGLAQQQLGQRDAAERSLLTAQRLDASDTQVLYALAVLCLQAGRRDEALKWVQQLAALSPTDPRVQQLLGALRP